MHRGQGATPTIRPRGKKGRVGDPVLGDCGIAEAPARAKNSRPASPSPHAGGSLATTGLDTDPTLIPLAQFIGDCSRHCSSDSVFDLDRPIDRLYTAAPNLCPL